MRIAIPDDYQHAIRSLDCISLLEGHQLSLVHDYLPDPEALAKKLGDPEILVLTRTRTRVDEALLKLLPNLKLISQTGKNAGHIDVDACTAKGIAIAEGRGNPIATAELTWALLMNGLRLLPQAIAGMQKGEWQSNIGRRVYGKRIGVWGYGKIGKRVAEYARVFGAEVRVWGSIQSREAAQEDGYRPASSKEDFFRSCDVISLHLRLKEKTRGIVKKTDLLRMKPDALLVNTARAALIETGALQEALKLGRPGFAALDVFDEEPIFDPEHPLLQMPQVICSPHLGYVEREGYELYFSIAFENILQFLNGNPVNIANPEVFRV